MLSDWLKGFRFIVIKRQMAVDGWCAHMCFLNFGRCISELKNARNDDSLKRWMLLSLSSMFTHV